MSTTAFFFEPGSFQSLNANPADDLHAHAIFLLLLFTFCARKVTCFGETVTICCKQKKDGSKRHLTSLVRPYETANILISQDF